MSYSTGVQNYIGVKPPQSLTTYNQIGSFSELQVSSSISATDDSLVDIGRPSKRFRSAYINEIDTDSTGIINGLSIATIDDGVIDRRKGTKQNLNPLIIGQCEGSSDGISACILNPVSRILVAVGATANGNDFRAFSSTSSIDTSDTDWTKRTINLTNMPSGVGIYNPRYMTYDPVNDSYIVLNASSSSNFYYCPASNLDGWETRPLPQSMTANGLTSFVYNTVCYTITNNSIGSMLYTTDNTNWNTIPNSSFLLPDGINVSPASVVAWDIIERPDWEEGDFDRYILLSATSANQSNTIWTSTSPIGPFTARHALNGSSNLRTLLYNPYYNTLMLSKTATFHVSVYKYYPNQLKTPTVITQFNLNLAPSLFSFQNDSYLPDFKTHVVSTNTVNGSTFGIGVYTWDGQSTFEFANQTSSTTSNSYICGHAKWSIDKQNGVAYSALRKGNTISNPPLSSNYALSKISFMFPPTALSNPTTSVSAFSNVNTERVMVSSKRVQMDKFDRLVSLTSDKVTGGVGSSQRPIKNVIFNTSVKSMGRDAYLYTKSSNQDTILANVNFENVLSNPSLLGKSIVSFGNMKNKDWTGTSSSSAAFTASQSFNSRFIGSGSMTGLNKTFAVSNNGGSIEILQTIDGGSTWQPFSIIPSDAFKTGVTKECSDIAYSPVYNTYVITAAHSSAINGNQIGDRCTLYSSDGGSTWNYCKFDIYVSPDTCYGMVRWISDWGTHGTFVLFTSIYTSNLLNCIMLSEDGINWRNTNNLPATMVATSSNSIRLFTKHEYDSSRNMLALTRQITNASNANNVTYLSTDGENWNEMSNLQAIPIYAKDIVISSTVTLPNSNVNFKVNTSGTEITATLTSGTYSPGALAAHVAAQMTAAYFAFSGSTATFFSGTYSQATGKFTFKLTSDLIFSPAAPTTFQFLFLTGTNASTSPRVELGFSSLDTTLADTQSSSTIQFFHPTLNNNRIDYLRTGSGINRVAYLKPGNYTPQTFATELARAINVQWVGSGLAAVTCTWSSATGFFTLSTTVTMDILWLTGANNTINCYREFGVAKVDVLASNTHVSTVNQHSDGGILRTIAYSPVLDIWVQVGCNTGAGTVGTTSSNVWWSKELGTAPTSYNWGWTPVDCFQQGVATLRPSFTDIIWCDSMQMFILLNANASFAGNVANDRNLWYSMDGKSFLPVTNVNSPKTILSTVNALSNNRLTWDNAYHTLFIDTPSANLATTITRYSFGALQRNELVHMPGVQYASATASSNNPASGATATWTFTFPQAFSVAPSFIIYSFTNNTTAFASSFTHWISAVTTTTFTVTAAAVGAAVAASAPVIKYIAWENF